MKKQIIHKDMKEHAVIEEIKNSNYLPDISGKVGELLNMLLDPDAFDMDLCIGILKKFDKSEEILIRILNANSKSDRNITDLKEAVEYLGEKNTKLILTAYLVRLLISNKKGRARIFDSYKYWRHCIGTAVAGSEIAKALNISDENKLFSYGLIHDIGISVLDICLPEKLTKINEKHLSGLHQIVSEMVVLDGLTHADVGKWICEEWGLPEEICDVVGYHHNPYIKENISKDVLIVNLADSISTNYYEGLIGNQSDFIYSEQTRMRLGITKEKVIELSENLEKEVEKMMPLVEDLF